MTAYRTSSGLTYTPITRFWKAPSGPQRRQVVMFTSLGLALAVVTVGAIVFILVCCGGGFRDVAVPALALVLPAFLLASARAKARAHRELWIDVSFCEQQRTVRFSSVSSPDVELPARDIIALRYREQALPTVSAVRTSYPRSSFAIVAETPQGDVPISVLVCTGATFIAAARPHLDSQLAAAWCKIAAAAG
jgi:hypothetical protein